VPTARSDAQALDPARCGMAHLWHLRVGSGPSVPGGQSVDLPLQFAIVRRVGPLDLPKLRRAHTSVVVA
jgi:hypothetical protein